MYLPYRFQMNPGSVDSIHNFKAIHLNCLKPPRLWYFVATTLKMNTVTLSKVEKT
jgi:hypothetical protein